MKKILLIIPMIFIVIAVIGFASADNGFCIGAINNYTCGDTILESCIFNDSMDCEITGLGGMPITGNDIVVDCDGYDFIGNGMASGFSLIGGDENIEIKNCNIIYWGDGIDITNSNHSLIHHNNFTNNTVDGIYTADMGFTQIYNNNFDCGEELGAFGITLALPFIGVGNNNVSYNNISNCFDGIDVYSSENLIQGNNIYSVISMTGIYLNSADLNQIIENDIYLTEPDLFGGSTGILLVDSSDSNYIYKNNISHFNSTGEGWDSGIVLYSGFEEEYPTDNTIYDNNLYDNFIGIGAYEAQITNISSNRIVGVEDSSFIAISLNSDLGDFVDLNNISTYQTGVQTTGSGFMSITNNSVENGFSEPYGFLILGSLVGLEGNTIENMSEGTGIVFVDSDGLILNNDLSDGTADLAYGIYIDTAEDGTIVIDNNTIYDDCSIADFYAIDAEGDVTTLITDEATYDFHYVDVLLVDIPNNTAELPEGYKDITIFNEITNTTDSTLALMDINITYNEGDVENESALNMYEYLGGGAWEPIGSTVFLDDNIIYFAITSFSEYAPLEPIFDEFPEVTLSTPLDDAYQNTTNKVSFSMKCSDDFGVSRMELWTNVTGTWTMRIYKNNPGNDTWWNYSYYSVPNGYYEWGVLCIDNATQETWSDNRTFTINYTGSGGGGGGGGSYCGNGICDIGEDSISCPSDCPSVICCKYSCLFFCSYSVVSPIECSGLGGTIVENSFCSDEPGAENLTGIGQTGGTSGEEETGKIKFQWWWLLIVGGAGLVIYIYNKRK